jgi:hypothetical protein
MAISNKIFVATPCYGGQVNVRYMESILELKKVLDEYEIGFTFFNVPFDSLVPRARNTCVNRFLADEDATHLMFIDADIQFDALSIIKMLLHDKNVICGAYPKKTVNFDEIKRKINLVENMQELIASSTRYAINLKANTKPDNKGLVEVLDAPTGFMLIKRKVITDMIENYPETQYSNDIISYKESEKSSKYYDLFQCKVSNNRYLSEDYAFCRLWQNIGGKIYIDLTVRLTHIGQFCYYGDPVKYFQFKQ